MTTVEPSYRRPWELWMQYRDDLDDPLTLEGRAAQCVSPWYVVRNLGAVSAVTYYRDKAKAIEHSQRLYMLTGETNALDVVDGLPRG